MRCWSKLNDTISSLEVSLSFKWWDHIVYTLIRSVVNPIFVSTMAQEHESCSFLFMVIRWEIFLDSEKSVKRGLPSTHLTLYIKKKPTQRRGKTSGLVCPGFPESFLSWSTMELKHSRGGRVMIFVWDTRCWNGRTEGGL